MAVLLMLGTVSVLMGGGKPEPVMDILFSTIIAKDVIEASSPERRLPNGRKLASHIPSPEMHMAYAALPAKSVAIMPIGEKLLKNNTSSGNIPIFTLNPGSSHLGILPNLNSR